MNSNRLAGFARSGRAAAYLLSGLALGSATSVLAQEQGAPTPDETDVISTGNRQRRTFTSVEVRWSAASEGVLAALRLSKSAQSADKVHFSDS